MGVLSMKSHESTIDSWAKLKGPIAANIAPDINGKRYYRMLVTIVDDSHIVYVSNDSTRIFTPDTLPSMLKHRLAIIKSRPTPPQIEGELSAFGLFLESRGGLQVEKESEMEIIGWHCGTGGSYIVIVSEEELNHIKMST
jgi:hypothetical protein